MSEHYGVYVRVGQKWACPWQYETYAEAQAHARTLRARAFYEAVKVKKVPAREQPAAEGGVQG